MNAVPIQNWKGSCIDSVNDFDIVFLTEDVAVVVGAVEPTPFVTRFVESSIPPERCAGGVSYQITFKRNSPSSVLAVQTAFQICHIDFWSGKDGRWR